MHLSLRYRTILERLLPSISVLDITLETIETRCWSYKSIGLKLVHLAKLTND